MNRKYQAAVILLLETNRLLRSIEHDTPDELARDLERFINRMPIASFSNDLRDRIRAAIAGLDL